jgi:chitodextrinase
MPDSGRHPAKEEHAALVLAAADSSQLSGNGHLRPAACAADAYSWTVLWEIEQLRAI